MNPEERDGSEMSVDEAVSALMQELPQPVQDFLKSDERGQIVRELSSKHALHVDQAGEFERAFLFMLLGISTPEEFTRSLEKEGLTQEAISSLSADINSRVFMRLRDAEREASQAAARPTPQKPAPLPPPALEYQPIAPANLPGSPIPAPMPATPITQAPQPFIPATAIEPTLVAQPVSQQHMVHAMPNTHQPGWHPAAAVHIFVPTHGPGAQMMHAQPTTPVPIATTPQEAPVMSPTPQPVYANPEESTSTAPQATPIPLTKDYGADPYRERV